MPYEQTDGVSIGGSLGPVLANIIIREFEQETGIKIHSFFVIKLSSYCSSNFIERRLWDKPLDRLPLVWHRPSIPNPLCVNTVAPLSLTISSTLQCSVRSHL